MQNYYSILNINIDSDNSEISEAFKFLALKHHPDKNNSQENYYIFCQICEAYEVLSDPKLRSLYNKFGEEKLKEGIFDEQNNLIGSYFFKGNPEEIFELFFGTINLHTAVLENGIDLSTFLQDNRNRNLETKNIYKSIIVNLKEVFNGCNKIVNYEIQKLNSDGLSTKKSNESINVNIRKGIENNEKITFKGKGNQYPGYNNSDLIITIKVENYKNFTRKGNNLYYLKNIELIDSLKAKSFKIMSLDDKELLVNVKDIINPKSIIILNGKGINNGDLIIKFNLLMPEISEDQKNRIIEVLQE